MDVTCPQCSTRYEFDEALVSNKGTTVKCTGCDRQFRVYRPRGSRNFSGWSIRTTSGQELHFAAMRELQGAILTGEVDTHDVLIPKDGSEPRRLGKIEELQSFFVRRSERKTNPRNSSSHPPAARASQPARSSQRSADTLRPPPSLGHSSAPGTALPKVPAVPKDIASGADTLGADTLGNAEATAHVQEGNAALQTTALGLGPNDGPNNGPRPSQKRAKDSAARGKGTDAMDRLENRKTRENARASTKKSERAKTTAARAPAAKESHEEVLDGDFDIAGSSAGELKRAQAGPAGSTEHEDRKADPGSWGVSQDGSEPEAPDAVDNAATQKRSPSETAAKKAGSRREAKPATPTAKAAADEQSETNERDSSPSIAPSTPSPSVARPSVLRQSEPYTDPRFSGYGHSNPRPTFPRVILGLVGLGLATLIAYTLVQQRTSPPTAAPSATAAADARVSALLQAGDRQLLKGDIDGAKEQYLKASGRSESDPRIHKARARVAVVLADLDWLRVRLSQSKSEARKKAEAALGRQLARLEALHTTFKKAGASKATLSRLSLDLERLRGNATKARNWTTDLKRNEPDTDRALALLELLGPAPDFKTAAARLRTAARSEQKLGRAQAALVYAWARAGEKKKAKEALERLLEIAPNHVLSQSLERFVSDAKERPKAAGSASAKAADGAKTTSDKSEPKPTSNYRTALQRGAAAKSSGDLDAAERHYQRALDLDPGNSEAMAGLAAIAKARGNSETAATRYQAMLSKNPSYIPAKLGLADLKLAQGDIAGALALYRQILSAAPGTSYAEQAQRSIARAQQQAQAKPTATPKPAPTTTASSAAPKTAASVAKPAPKSSATAAPKAKPDPTATAKPSPTPQPTSQPPSPPPIDTTDLPE